MRYAFIYFKHTVKPGSSRPREDQISIILDPAFQKLSFYDMRSQKEERIFFCYHHERFHELVQALDAWVQQGIDSSVKHHFLDLEVWARWRTHVFFEDGDVHWQVLVENDDGTCSVYVHLDPFFPKELWHIYQIAERMDPKK